MSCTPVITSMMSVRSKSAVPNIALTPFTYLYRFRPCRLSFSEIFLSSKSYSYPSHLLQISSTVQTTVADIQIIAAIRISIIPNIVLTSFHLSISSKVVRIKYFSGFFSIIFLTVYSAVINSMLFDLLSNEPAIASKINISSTPFTYIYFLTAGGLSFLKKYWQIYFCMIFFNYTARWLKPPDTIPPPLLYELQPAHRKVIETNWGW